jgi:hypothetical protein
LLNGIVFSITSTAAHHPPVILPSCKPSPRTITSSGSQVVSDEYTATVQALYAHALYERVSKGAAVPKNLASGASFAVLDGKKQCLSPKLPEYIWHACRTSNRRRVTSHRSTIEYSAPTTGIETIMTQGLRTLARSGLKVSPLCLGTMNFGNEQFGCDERTSIGVIHAYLDGGHNFIDTANVYSATKSETIICSRSTAAPAAISRSRSCPCVHAALH